ncbi:MAG TPA: A24 family peptidase [Pseudonocardiaceae bacterium]|nr:A24 family peptidase [Pseudonocardiaceae bacterium]
MNSTNLLATAGFGLIGTVVGALGRHIVNRALRSPVCRPPWCELACAGLSALLGWRAAAGLLPSWWLPVPLVLGWFAVPLTAADLARRRLPDVLTLPAYPLIGLVVALAATAGPDAGLGCRALAGVILFGGAHALVRVLAPTAMGGGDVKLAGSLGAVLGAIGWPAMAVAATLAAMGTALLAMARRMNHAPHGPSLLAATWLVAAFPGQLPGTG